MDRYVCAFRGRRDSYQVPLALAEGGMLDQFITDAYAFPALRKAAERLPEIVRKKVLFRHQAGIPDDRIKCLWGTTLLEHARHRCGVPPELTFAKLDQRFSHAASERADRSRAHLFLYSPYAWEAFVATHPHSPRKVLFQYHPHPDVERRILEEDRKHFPFVAESFASETGAHLTEALRHRSRDCWKHADLIFCASSFTKHSLSEAGCDQARCRIVPYGIELPTVAEGQPRVSDFHAVFVGSGHQRKGLHHLLLAWKKAFLKTPRKLTLICRVIDPGIEQLAATTPHVELHRGVSESRLDRLYASSSLFVMPSLVEWFGQVYLEALAQGCPVLGTANTGLPDLGGEADGIFLVTPGNVDELANKLEQLSLFLPVATDLRCAARVCAGRFTWGAFRKKLRNNLGSGAIG